MSQTPYVINYEPVDVNGSIQVVCTRFSVCCLWLWFDVRSIFAPFIIVYSICTVGNRTIVSSGVTQHRWIWVKYETDRNPWSNYNRIPMGQKALITDIQEILVRNYTLVCNVMFSQCQTISILYIRVQYYVQPVPNYFWQFRLLVTFSEKCRVTFR